MCPLVKTLLAVETVVTRHELNDHRVALVHVCMCVTLGYPRRIGLQQFGGTLGPVTIGTEAMSQREGQGNTFLVHSEDRSSTCGAEGGGPGFWPTVPRSIGCFTARV